MRRTRGLKAPAETIRFATGVSALGTVLVAWSDRGICALLLGDDAAELEGNLRRRLPKCCCEAAGPESDTLQLVLAFLSAPGLEMNLPLDPRGTPFQCRVWEALRQLPTGVTTTYGELAEQIGVTGGARAIAAACAANPMAVAIPCHRVIGRNGKLSGYRWGIDRKAALLAREACVLSL